MILGIKYCGGCNPTYDRGAAVAELKQSLSDLDVSFVSYDEQKQYDGCILVLGCNRNCVSQQKFSNCKCLYTASCKEDFLEIKTKLYAQLSDDVHME